MKKNIEVIKEKIFNIDNLPVILFFACLINFIPNFISNFINKGPSGGIPTIVKIILMMIEYIILFLYYYFNYKSIKINIKKTLLLIVITFILFIVQLYNYLTNNFYFFDILNIGIFFVNVLLFYIILYDYKIKEKSLIKFYKMMIYFALFSIIWNFCLFYKEILAQINIINSNVDYSYINNIKGFFSNRAGLSFVILLAIISNTILIRLDKRKKIYYFLYPIFFLGIWSTHSKSEFLLMTFLFIGIIFIEEKISILKKILICLCSLIISFVGFVNVLGYFPDIKNKIDKVVEKQNIEAKIDQGDNGNPKDDRNQNEEHVTNDFDIVESNSKLNELVVTKDRIFRLSGRLEIWKTAISYLINNPLRILFGVGKFNSTQYLFVDGILYEHFHNLILEFIMTGGIVELIYVISLFGSVLFKVFKSNIDKIYKKIYLLSFTMYVGMSMVETYGKFSIGFYDCLCLTFFIAIPLLHANSFKIKKSKSSKNKNIALIDYDITVIGGVEKITERLANHFSQKYNVIIISLNKENDVVPYNFNDNIKIMFTNNNKNKRMRTSVRKNLGKVSKLLNKNNVNLAFCMGHYATFVTVIDNSLINTRLIYCDHGAYVNSIDDKLMCFIRKVNYRMTDHTVLLTERNKKDYINYVKADDTKISVIYNYIPKEEFNYYNKIKYNIKNKNIVTISRLSIEKGIDLLISVAIELKKIYKEKWQWHIYGDGNMKEELISQIKKYDLSDNIILKGEDKSARDKLKNYALYSLTSYHEGLPIVLLEAKVRKLPIVSFDITTGPNEIVANNKNGFLIDCYDTKMMAEKIKYLLENDDIRCEFSEKTKMDLNKFNEQIILDKWDNLVNNMEDK